MINIKFKFRAVGQGAFYTGIFRHTNGKQFSFVYDCGSHSSRKYIDSEISNFVKESYNKKIDILFISHFHADHINKINELLKKTNGAKYAILPYLTPEELLLAYTDVHKSDDDPDTLLFIQNPTEFLLENNVDKIIFIHPNNEDGLNEDNIPNVKDPDPERFLVDDFSFDIYNGLLENNNINEINKKVSHYYDVGVFSIIDFWEFKFFNKHRDFTILNNFISDIKTLLGINDFDFNKIADFIKKNPTTFDSNLNTIYSKNFGYRQLINDTSLVIFHGPLINFNHDICLMNNCFSCIYFCGKGTLLTGDIKFDQDCLNQINRKWTNSKYSESVSIFQIPHHGANHYIESFIVNYYKNVNGWVINYGLGNTHKHPRQEVIDIISDKSKGKILSNTQVDAVNYGFLLYR